MGYKTFVFVNEKILPKIQVSGDVARNTIENAWFKVIFDPAGGCVRSIIDKKTGREMVDASAGHGFGQYLYQQFDRQECDGYVNKYVLRQYHRSHRKITGKHHYVPTTAEHVDFSPSGMKLEIELLGYAVVGRLIPAMNEDQAVHTASLSVTLYNDLPWLDMKLHVINHSATENPEAGWLALPLKIDQPDFRIKGPGSIFDPARDVIKGSNFSYF